MDEVERDGDNKFDFLERLNAEGDALLHVLARESNSAGAAMRTRAFRSIREREELEREQIAGDIIQLILVLKSSRCPCQFFAGRSQLAPTLPAAPP